MSSEPEMKAVLQSYVDAFNKRDADAIAALYAEDAVVEDPYGTPAREGIAAITEFYAHAVTTGAEIALDGPIRGSQGPGAAMAFTIIIGGMTIKAIDVMEFNEDGKIKSMKAFWGPSDVTA